MLVQLFCVTICYVTEVGGELVASCCKLSLYYVLSKDQSASVGSFAATSDATALQKSAVAHTVILSSLALTTLQICVYTSSIYNLLCLDFPFTSTTHQTFHCRHLADEASQIHRTELLHQTRWPPRKNPWLAVQIPHCRSRSFPPSPWILPN